MGQPADPGHDVAQAALTRLVTELDRCVAELERARVRAEHLLRERAAGRAWFEVVTEESRPLVVESISTVLGTLATAGHAWRREEAAALRSEQVSINRIAALFGVTRQRISALLRERDEDAAAAAGEGGTVGAGHTTPGTPAHDVDERPAAAGS